MKHKDLGKISVLIPAYMPSEEMKPFINELCSYGFKEVIVINDGSGSEYDEIFHTVARSGAVVLHHAINMGKGRALKTGINYYITQSPEGIGIVTADADGQHLVKDIIRVAQELMKSDKDLVLGARKLSRDMPLPNRLGNSITKGIFSLISGSNVSDTQTGLRGIPYRSLKNMLQLKGERYEYEMSMLLELNALDLSVREVEIETVYINDNEGSHFDPFKDSWRIYSLIFGFSTSSFMAFMVDFIIYTFIVLKFGVGAVIFAIVGARVISSIFNFFMNRTIMTAGTSGGQNIQAHIVKYYILALCILGANIGLVSLFLSLGIGPVAAKFITECVLFPLSFIIQKRVVFK